MAALVGAALALSGCPEIASKTGAEDDPPQPTIPEVNAPALEPPECRSARLSRICGDIRLLGLDLLEFPATNRLVRSRLVVTPARRLRYEVRMRSEGASLDFAVYDYDGTFERFGWLLDPGSPPAFTLAPRKEITRHYVGVASVPPPGTGSVPNKGYEATLHLTEVPTSGARPDVIVEGVIQTIDPVLPTGATG